MRIFIYLSLSIFPLTSIAQYMGESTEDMEKSTIPERQVVPKPKEEKKKEEFNIGPYKQGEYQYFGKEEQEAREDREEKGEGQ